MVDFQKIDLFREGLKNDMEIFHNGSPPRKNKVFFSETRPLLSNFLKSVFSPLKIPKSLENFSKM